MADANGDDDDDDERKHCVSRVEGFLSNNRAGTRWGGRGFAVESGVLKVRFI